MVVSIFNPPKHGVKILSVQDVFRVQPTVDFPIGGHVNILHDYKKT